MTDDLWKPACKEDVVDLLMKVQVGQVSCRFAADVLFPHFNPTSECNARYHDMVRVERREYEANLPRD